MPSSRVRRERTFISSKAAMSIQAAQLGSKASMRVESSSLPESGCAVSNMQTTRWLEYGNAVEARHSSQVADLPLIGQPV